MNTYIFGKKEEIDLKELIEYSLKEDARKIIKDSFKDCYGEDGLVQPPYNPTMLAALLEVNSTHMACVDVIAGDVAGRGYYLENITPEVEEFFKNLPDPVTTVLYNLVSDYQSLGYAALAISYDDDGRPVDLYHVPGHTLRRHADDKRVAQKVGGSTVWFKLAGVEGDLDKDTGEFKDGLTSEKKGDTLIWFNNYNPRSYYYGLAPITPAIPAIYMGIAARKYNASFFKNYGVPSLLMIIKGSFTDIDPNNPDTNLSEKAKEALQKVMDNPHSAMILTLKSTDSKAVDIEIKEMGGQSQEGEFINLMQLIDDEILSVHRVPPYRISINRTGSLAGNTAIESSRIYYESVISPIQQRIEDQITKWVIREGFESETRFKLNRANLREFKNDVDSTVALVQAGVLSPAEAREYLKGYFNFNEDIIGPEAETLYNRGVPLDAAAAMSLQPVAEIAKQIRDVNERID